MTRGGGQGGVDLGLDIFGDDFRGRNGLMHCQRVQPFRGRDRLPVDDDAFHKPGFDSGAALSIDRLPTAI